MMDTSFYRIHHPTYLSSSPIQINRQTTPVRKVVSIPVQYVGSERSRPDSAVKIQKVFRGFLVRKSMKKISAIRSEVNEIEKRMSTKEIVELIQKDSKERLKVNEMLMSLLFKLDSVRGVDSGVRDCRKAVIKKVIALQEMVDAIVAADQTLPDNAEESENLPAGKKNVDQTLGEQDTISPEVKGCIDNSLENAVDLKLELENHVESMPAYHEVEAVIDSVNMPYSTESQGNVELTDVGGDANVEEKEVVEEDGDNDVTAASVSECAESVGTSQFESQADSSANPQSLIEGDEDANGDDDDDALGKHDVEIHRPDEKEGHMNEQLCGGAKEEVKKSRELLEKLMMDNEKMMGLMVELFERNERQTRLLSMLSQRVEQLETAFICERLRRKKKRNAAGLVDCLESTQDTRKCGKKL